MIDIYRLPEVTSRQYVRQRNDEWWMIKNLYIARETEDTNNHISLCRGYLFRPYLRSIRQAGVLSAFARYLWVIGSEEGKRIIIKRKRTKNSFDSNHPNSKHHWEKAKFSSFKGLSFCQNVESTTTKNAVSQPDSVHCSSSSSWVYVVYVSDLCHSLLLTKCCIPIFSEKLQRTFQLRRSVFRLFSFRVMMFRGSNTVSTYSRMRNLRWGFGLMGRYTASTMQRVNRQRKNPLGGGDHKASQKTKVKICW